MNLGVVGRSLTTPSPLRCAVVVNDLDRGWWCGVGRLVVVEVLGLGVKRKNRSLRGQELVVRVRQAASVVEPAGSVCGSGGRVRM
jgi:hypothetical protein